MDILSLVAGFILGILGSVLLFVLQFRASTAWRRVNLVADATSRIVAAKGGLTPLRNTYRYSLGVIIGKLAAPRDTGTFPCLIEPSADGWGLFDKYIRFVIQDITAYSFLGTLLSSFQPFSRLNALTKLCNQLETVIGLLDGAHGDQALTISADGEYILSVNQQYKAVVSEQYAELFECWREWKDKIATFQRG